MPRTTTKKDIKKAEEIIEEIEVPVVSVEIDPLEALEDDEISKEIAKCDLVCANCHCEIHNPN
jgi:hypothetical protein